MDLLRLHIDKLERISGFVAPNARHVEKVSVVFKAGLTSDHYLFYKLMDNIGSLVLSHVNLVVDSIYQFLVLWHQDESVDVFVNDFPVVINLIAKKTLRQGQVINHEDIADIQSLRFEGIEIQSTDNLIYCFKVGWKFGLFFDLGRTAGEASADLDIEGVSRSIGGLYRYLAFQHVYEILESSDRFAEIKNDGWYPFMELVAKDFKILAEIYDSKFEIASRIGQLLQGFSAERVRAFTSKWWSNPIFRQKQSILEAGIKAYLQNTSAGNLQCLKTLLPEIEELIRLQRLAETREGRGSTARLIKYIGEKATPKAGSEHSLLLPTKFVAYLTEVIFGEFDLEKGEVNLSHHSSSHGVANPDQYTRARALQAILSLDQIYFYLRAA